MIKLFKKIPWWGYVQGLAILIIQKTFYNLAEIIRIKNYAINPKIPPIDNLIPILPGFIIIYVFSYFFWIFGGAVVSITSRENNKKFIISILIAIIIGFLILTFIPTVMSRSAEGLLEIANKPGIFNQLLAFIYANDGGEIGFNLCPSFHCLISWGCYLGIRKQKEIPKWFCNYTLIMVILICISTLFTKQHYIIDVILGTLIAWFSFALVEKIFDKKKNIY